MSYTPQADSLAGRVCAFFRTHPDEELEGRDIATKFSVNSASVSALLASAMAANVITRGKDSEGTVVFKAGPNLHATEPTNAPSQHTPAPRKAAAGRRDADLPDPAALVLTPGVPIPMAAKSIVARYGPVFERMNVGDSFEVAEGVSTRLFRSAQIFGKPLNRKFLCRRVDGGQARIWRTE